MPGLRSKITRRASAAAQRSAYSQVCANPLGQGRVRGLAEHRQPDHRPLHPAFVVVQRPQHQQPGPFTHQLEQSHHAFVGILYRVYNNQAYPISIGEERAGITPLGSPEPQESAVGRAAAAAGLDRRRRDGVGAMGFTELCIRRPVFATVLSLVLLLAGQMSGY